MKKILVSIFLFSLLLPVFALETPEKQIKNAIDDELQEKEDKKETDKKDNKPIDYKKLNHETKLKSGKARCHGHVSAGYEHVKSKYQAQTSINRFKPEFQERIKTELNLMKVYDPPKKTNTKQKETKDENED